MKRIKILTVAAFVFAAGSAFITMPKPPNPGDYLSKKTDGEPCEKEQLNRNDCKGNGAICKINFVTYYVDDHCGTPLKKN